MVLTRAAARGLVAAKAEDPNQTAITAAQYNTALDLAQTQFAMDAKAIVKSVPLTSVYAGATGPTSIALPNDFLGCVLVRHLGIKLAPTTPYDLAFQSGQDFTQLPAGTPTMYYIDRQNDALVLVPGVDVGDAGANETLDYISVPAVMTSDANSILNGDQILSYYNMAVVNWAAAECLTYLPFDPTKVSKREVLLKDYQRYTDQTIMVYNNMADQPIQMRGGKHWQDQTLYGVPNAFD